MKFLILSNFCQNINAIYLYAQYESVGEIWGIWRNRYTVSGTMGLQLEFVSGRRLLIGTNKPKELTEVLNSIGKLTILKNTATQRTVWHNDGCLSTQRIARN